MQEHEAPRYDEPERDRSPGQRLTRLLRIAMVFLIVLGIEWKVADPADVARSQDLSPMPWAMLALLFPIGLGVWAYEATSHDRPDFKADVLWGVLIATLCYVGLSLGNRFL